MGDIIFMKRILALGMASIIAVMTLASCESKYTEGEKFLAGTFVGEKYENVTIGIGVNVPEGYADVFDLPEVDGVTHDFGVADENGNSIFISVEDNSKGTKVEKVAENSLTALIAQYENMGYTIDEQKLEDYTVGDNTYRGYTITVTKGVSKTEEKGEAVEESVTMTQAGFFVKCDNKIAIVAATGKTVEAKQLIADSIFAA